MTSVWTILWSDEGKQNPENTWVVESKEDLKAQWKPEGGIIKLVVTKAADFLVKCAVAGKARGVRLRENINRG